LFELSLNLFQELGAISQESAFRRDRAAVPVGDPERNRAPLIKSQLPLTLA
jgi:hypothetical protein